MASAVEGRTRTRRRWSAGDGHVDETTITLTPTRSVHGGLAQSPGTTPSSACTTSSPGMFPMLPSQKKKSLTPGQARWAHYAKKGQPGAEPTRTISVHSTMSGKSADSSMFRSDDDEDFEMTDEEEEMMGDHLDEDECDSPFVTAPSPDVRQRTSMPSALEPAQGRRGNEKPARSRLGVGIHGVGVHRVSLSSSALQQKVPGVQYGSTTFDQAKLESKLEEQERQLEPDPPSDAPPSPNRRRRNPRSLEDSLMRIAPIPTRYGADSRKMSNVSGYDGSSIVTEHSMETTQMRNTTSSRQLSMEGPNTVAVSRPSEPFRLSSRGPNRHNSLPKPSAASAGASSDPLAPSGHDDTGPSRRPSGPMLMPMDAQGHAMSTEELREVLRQAGKCQYCGIVSTHTKTKYGPFGVFRRMQPITQDGKVYQGFCLACHDVTTLRRVLNNPDIPDECLRHSAEVDEIAADGLTTIDSHGESSHDEVVPSPSSRKPNGFGHACQNWKLQLLCFGLIVGSIIGGIFAAISFSRPAEPYVAVPPTPPPSFAPTSSHPSMAPSSNEWVWTAEIIGAEDTFGFQVDFDLDASRVAIAAPKARQGRGLVEVYERVGKVRANTVVDSLSDLERWARVGEPIVGDEIGDDASLGMDLSGDGQHVAVGYPGNGDGFVRVFWIIDGEWAQKGQTLGGPSLNSQFGASVALDLNGTHLAVGAPKAGTQEQGMFQAFKWDGASWVNEGAARYGDDFGDHFGTSVAMNDAGNRVIVGTPDDDTKWEDGGRSQFFTYAKENPYPDESCIADCWADMTLDSPIWGEEAGYRFGHTVSISGDGLKFASSALSHDDYVSSPEGVEEYHEDVGHVRVVTYDETAFLGTDAGFPVSGTRKGHGFGFDVALDHSGIPFVASTLNEETQTGVVRAFGFDAFGSYQQTSDEIGALPLGGGIWAGPGPVTFGPSVSMANKGTTIAVGYQSVLIHDGEEVPGVVRIFQNQGTPAGFLPPP